MTSAEIQPFDFRTAGTADAAVRTLKNWLLKTTGTFTDSWAAVSDTVVALNCRSVRTRTFEEGVQSCSEESIGWTILLGEKKIPTLACVSCLDLVSIIGCLFGAGPIDDFEDRKLTTIEMSLCEMIFETISSSLSDAWLGQEPLVVTVGEFDESPQFSRVIAAKELVLCTHVELTVTETKANVTWLLPRKEIETLLEEVAGTSLRRPVNQTNDVVQKIAIEVVGQLGKIEISMRKLNDLQVGDVVVFDQKIDEPVMLYVDNQPFYQGWPGRLGKQQGVEIAKVL